MCGFAAAPRPGGTPGSRAASRSYVDGGDLSAATECRTACTCPVRGAARRRCSRRSSSARRACPRVRGERVVGAAAVPDGAALYRCHVGEDCPDLTDDRVLDEGERGEAKRDRAVIMLVRVVIHPQHARARLSQAHVAELVEEFGVVEEPEAAVAQEHVQRRRQPADGLRTERVLVDAHALRGETLPEADSLPRVEAHLGAVVTPGRLEERGLDVVELHGTQPAALPDEEPIEDDAAG